MLSILERTGGVDYPLFLRSIWNLSVRTGYQEPTLSELAAMVMPRQQAKAVFDSIVRSSVAASLHFTALHCMRVVAGCSAVLPRLRRC
jgi:hypothetical protein